MLLLTFMIALIICVILRFGFYNESSAGVNAQENTFNITNKALLPVCEKGAVAANWNNNLLIFGGKTKTKYIRSKFLNYVLYLNTSHSRYQWQESFVDLNNTAKNIRLPQALWKSDGVLLGNNLYVYGGSTGPHRQTEQNKMWRFNLLSKTWKKLKFAENAYHPYVRGHCMASYGDIIILFGGKNISGYDQNWILRYNTKEHQQGFMRFNVVDSNIPAARQATTCQIINNKFIMFGGRLESKRKNKINGHSVLNKTFNYYNDLWSFDLSTSKWIEIKGIRNKNNNMEQWPRSTAHLSSVIYDENKFVITAGHDMNYVLKQHWMFDFDSYIWHRLKDLPMGEERCLHVGTYINGKGILIFGGQHNLPDIVGAKNVFLNDVLLYRFDTNEWIVVKKDHCKKAEEYWTQRRNL